MLPGPESELQTIAGAWIDGPRLNPGGFGIRLARMTDGNAVSGGWFWNGWLPIEMPLQKGF